MGREGGHQLVWGRVFELMARGASEGRGSPIDGEGNRLSTSLWDRWAHGRGGGRWLLVRERRGGRCRKGQGGCVGGDGGGNAASSSAPRVSPPPTPPHPPPPPPRTHALAGDRPHGCEARGRGGGRGKLGGGGREAGGVWRCGARTAGGRRLPQFSLA